MHTIEAAFFTALLWPALLATGVPLDVHDRRLHGIVIYALVLVNAALFVRAWLHSRAGGHAKRS